MSWTATTLGEVCEIVGGATPKTSVEEYWDGDIPWVTPKDLSDLDGAHEIGSTPRSLSHSGLKSCAATLLPAGSVLLSSRAPIGHVAINTVPMATNQGFKSLVPDPERVHPKFLFWWLRRNRPMLESMGTGATFKEISKKTTSAVPIELPPIGEQQRIAAVLDAADALRSKRHQAIAELDTLTQAIFVDMFGEVRETRQLGDVAEFKYGTSEKSARDGLPTLRIPNVVGGRVGYDGMKFVPVSKAEEQRLALRDNDLLFVRSNGNPDYVGRCAEFSEEQAAESGFQGPVVYASYLIRARLNDQLLAPFASAYLNGRLGRRQLRDRCKTSAGQYNLNTKGLGSVEIPAVSIAEQQSFAARVAEVRGRSRLLEASRVQLDSLFASLQQRAFRGEL